MCRRLQWVPPKRPRPSNGTPPDAGVRKRSAGLGKIEEDRCDGARMGAPPAPPLFRVGGESERPGRRRPYGGAARPPPFRVGGASWEDHCALAGGCGEIGFSGVDFVNTEARGNELGEACEDLRGRMQTYVGIWRLTRAYADVRRSYEFHESSGASPFSMSSGASPFSVLIAISIRGKVGEAPCGSLAKCAQGRWCAGADFWRVRFALGSLADRPEQGSWKAVRWGVWWCACGRRARGGAGAVVC